MNHSAQTDWIGHHIRHRELFLEFNIVNKEPLRIGSGRREELRSPIDLPILKITINGVKKPYIPGSSLKGIFRSFMDTFVRSRGGSTCPGVGGFNCFNKVKEQLIEYVRNGQYNELAQLIWDNYCLSCKVFGSGSYRSKVYFYDFMPLSDVKIGFKPGIAIDRRTGTATRGALYNVEFVHPGGVFNGGIRVFDVPNYVLGIIALTLFEINEGRIKIGGFKTRGFGRVEIRDLTLNINLFNEKAGSVKNGKLVLNKMDSIDVSIEYVLEDGEIKNGMIVLERDRAWGLLETIMKKTVFNPELVRNIVNIHKYR